jgi:3-hydroxyisobutyrate dehydrogenase-like beta-hydroxyacid dehydrogenase
MESEAGVQKIRVGCLGLGNMGSGIAENILRAGFEVTVFDVRPEARNRLQQLGAKSAESPAEAARDVSVLTVTVLNDQQVRQVLLGEDGAASVLPPGAVVIVHSTVSPHICRELAEVLAVRGVQLIDAPVSGGASAADGGALTLMIGGQEDAVTAAAPVLEVVSRERFHVGPVGTGQIAKLVNNLMGIVNRVAVGEGLALARAAGLREDAMLGVLRASSGNSWQVEHWRDMQEVARDSTTGAEGMAQMAKKDLGLAHRLGDELGIAMPMTAQAYENTAALFSAIG